MRQIYWMMRHTFSSQQMELTHDAGKTWKIIIIDTGAYEVSSLNNEIQRIMTVNGDCNNINSLFYIVVTVNASKLTSIVSIDNPTYKVDFSVPNSIGYTLGFGKVVIGAGYNELPRIVDITMINKIRVHFDIVNGKYVDGL